MSENIEKKFKNLFKALHMEDMDKPAEFYVVYYRDPSVPGDSSFIYEKFKSKAERDKWLQEEGKDVLRVHGGEFRSPEKPLSIEEIEKEKNSQ